MTPYDFRQLITNVQTWSEEGCSDIGAVSKCQWATRIMYR